MEKKKKGYDIYLNEEILSAFKAANITSEQQGVFIASLIKDYKNSDSRATLYSVEIWEKGGRAKLKKENPDVDFDMWD